MHSPVNFRNGNETFGCLNKGRLCQASDAQLLTLFICRYSRYMYYTWVNICTTHCSNSTGVLVRVVQEWQPEMGYRILLRRTIVT
jgi:hypothetical protein